MTMRIADLATSKYLKQYKKVVTHKQESYVDDRELGIYDKFKVTRTDGRSAEGERHEHCPYFVLDLSHDKHCLDALVAYSKSAKAARRSKRLDVRTGEFGEHADY